VLHATRLSESNLPASYYLRPRNAIQRGQTAQTEISSLDNRDERAAWAESDNSQLPRRVEVGLRYGVELLGKRYAIELGCWVKRPLVFHLVQHEPPSTIY
jgi:hypothetical protein